jgi:hypothetical protein
MISWLHNRILEQRCPGITNRIKTKQPTQERVGCFDEERPGQNQALRLRKVKPSDPSLL